MAQPPERSDPEKIDEVRPADIRPAPTIRRKALAGTVIALALNVFAGYVGWRTIRSESMQSDWLVSTQATLIQLDATMSHVVDAETGARGFALTGKELFLDPYTAAKRFRMTDLVMLRKLTDDMPEVHSSLKVLPGRLQSAYAFIDGMIASRLRTGESSDSGALEENKRRVDLVRATIQEFRDKVERALVDRNEANRSAQRATRIIALSGTALGVFLLTFAGLAIRREIGKNSELQEHIDQRTAALHAENAKARLAQEQLRASEEMYRLIIDGIHDYAVYMLNPMGEVASWNAGAKRITGYDSEEILGRHFSCFYLEEDHNQDRAEMALGEAVRSSHYRDRGWRLRKDGSRFWGNTVITPMYDQNGTLRGFSKVVADITERKQAEDRMHESQAQLAGVIQSAMDGVVTVDDKQRVVLFNGAAERIFGYPSSEAIGQTLERFIPQRFRAAHSEHIRGFSNTGVTSRAMGLLGPLWGVRANGEEFPIEASISQVEVDGKKLFTAIIRDITEREATQAALREFAQVLDLAQVLVRDLNGSIVLWTLGAEELYGFTKQEVVGRISHELFQTEFPEPHEQIEEKLRSSGRWEGELVHRRRDGSRIVVFSVWVVHRDSEDRPVRILEANVDITARKQAEDELGRTEKALRVQTRLLHSILEGMGEGLIAADERGKFLLWNTAAENILGRGATNLGPSEWVELYGLYLTDGVTPFPTEELPLARALLGHAATAEMIVRNPKLKADVWIEVSARPLRDERGILFGGVVALRDITQRKADECEIRKLNDELEQRVARRTAELEAANKELEAFTYSISHDLRAPLRHIAGFTGMLMEESGARMDERSTKLLRRVQESTRMMGQMVDELLNLARVGRQTPSPQVTGLNSIVNEVRGVLRSECEGRIIDWRIARLPFVECDPTLIRMVFQNLISNALKYSRPRSPAIIEIGKTDENAIYVRDNGVGFSMKYADKLFGVFQRLHRAEDFEGTGVGLATVQRIIQKHGGKIWVEAELDRGATFYFTVSPPEIASIENREVDKEQVCETR